MVDCQIMYENVGFCCYVEHVSESDGSLCVGTVM